MKNILLPTDFSKNSVNAIEYAMEFFKNWECDFYILNVQKTSEYITDDIMTSSPKDSIYKSIASDNKKDLEQLMTKLKKKYKDQSYTIHPLFDFDNFTDAVNQAVISHNIELIIMGTNGATGAREAIFGSNTLQVIRNVECAIMAIPQDYSFKGIRKTLLFTLPQEELNEIGLHPYLELLQIHQPELHLIELDDDAIELCEKEDNVVLSRIFKAFPYQYYCLNQAPEWTVIDTATQLLKIDMMAMFDHHKTFIERILLGTQTPILTYKSRVPLLFLQKD